MIGVQTFTDVRQLTIRVSGALMAPVLVLVTVLALGLASLDVPATSFRSPDEYANFLFTSTYAETWRLYYVEDYLAGDEENLLHPRGALTHEGRAVPFNYLGLSVLYAPAYRLLGDDVRYVAVPLALLTVCALAAAGSMLVPRRPWLAWAAVLGAAPIVYYLNRPFLNTLPALAFLSAGLYLAMGYYRSEERAGRLRLLGASSAFALAAFARYELAVFETAFVVILLFQKHGTDWRRALKDLALYSAVVAAVFVAPVLVLNEQTYGSPFTFGYQLFNEAYFPERTASGLSAAGLLTSARALLLPAYPLDLGLAFHAFSRQVLGVAPIFAIVAALGLYSVVRNRAIPIGFLIAYGLLALYTFLYRGAGYSWLADAQTANLEASVIRYALPVYVGFYLLTVYGLAQVERAQVALALVGILAFVGILGVLRDVDGSLMHIRTQVRASDEVTRTDVLPYTETDALIYTDIFDKTIGPYRNVASWWGGVRGTYGGFFRPDEVARSIARVHPSRPVYVYLFEDDFAVPKLEEALAPFGLTVTALPQDRLYRIDRAGGTSAGRPSR